MRKVRWQDKNQRALYAWALKWNGKEGTAIMKNRNGDVIKRFKAKDDDINETWRILFNKVYDYGSSLVGRELGSSELYTYNPFFMCDANTKF